MILGFVGVTEIDFVAAEGLRILISEMVSEESTLSGFERSCAAKQAPTLAAHNSVPKYHCDIFKKLVPLITEYEV